MSKVLAIVVLIIFVWWAIPHLARGEWIAPTALMPNSWIVKYDQSDYAQALATPPQGYGWYRYDFWNGQTPLQGRPVTKRDFRLEY